MSFYSVWDIVDFVGLFVGLPLFWRPAEKITLYLLSRQVFFTILNSLLPCTSLKKRICLVVLFVASYFTLMEFLMHVIFETCELQLCFRAHLLFNNILMSECEMLGSGYFSLIL